MKCVTINLIKKEKRVEILCSIKALLLYTNKKLL